MKLYRCPVCGNVVEMLEEKNGHFTCCGNEMELLVANEQDGAKEKHVPIYHKENDTLVIEVGEVHHPMEENHYIEFIMMETKNKVIRVNLSYHDQPIVTFPYEKGATIYGYCNQHGLWKTKVED